MDRWLGGSVTQEAAALSGLNQNCMAWSRLTPSISCQAKWATLPERRTKPVLARKRVMGV